MFEYDERSEQLYSEDFAQLVKLKAQCHHSRRGGCEGLESKAGAQFRTHVSLKESQHPRISLVSAASRACDGAHVFHVKREDQREHQVQFLGEEASTERAAQHFTQSTHAC